MSSKVTYKCDIDGPHEGAILVEMRLPLVRITEENEGRAVEPYIQILPLDICDKHYKQIVNNRTIPTVSGAMGYNKITLPEEAE